MRPHNWKAHLKSQGGRGCTGHPRLSLFDPAAPPPPPPALHLSFNNLPAPWLLPPSRNSPGHCRISICPLCCCCCCWAEPKPRPFLFSRGLIFPLLGGKLTTKTRPGRRRFREIPVKPAGSSVSCHHIGSALSVRLVDERLKRAAEPNLGLETSTQPERPGTWGG